MDDNPVTLTLSQPGGVKVVWPVLNIQSGELQSWSLMPEAFELGLSTQEMADLLEFLVNRPR